MNRSERLDRIKVLGRIALGLARRNDRGYNVDLPAGHFRAYDVAHNEISVTHRRSVDDNVPSTLVIRYLSKKVFEIEWINGGSLIKTSFKPGAWEALLVRYSRLPIFA
jgi:hypothetical protein